MESRVIGQVLRSNPAKRDLGLSDQPLRHMLRSSGWKNCW